MKANKDELSLLHKRVDKKNTLSSNSQALRIALYTHLKSYEYIKKALNKYGVIPPFDNIFKLQEQMIGFLVIACETHKTELVVNNWNKYITLPDTFIEICEVCIANEIELINMYDNIIKHIDIEDIKDLFFRLQATSYNEILPSLRAFTVTTKSENTEVDGEFSQEKLMEKFSEISSIANQISSGKIDQQQINTLLSSLNMPLISGALLGALGLIVAKEMKNKDEEDIKKKES